MTPEETEEHEKIIYHRGCELWSSLREYYAEDPNATIAGISFFLGRLTFDGMLNWKEFDSSVRREVKHWITQQGSIH